MAPLEGIGDVICTHRVEVVGDLNHPGKKTDPPLRRFIGRIERNHLHHRPTGLGDDECLLAGCPIDKSGQVRFCLMDADLFHGLSLLKEVQRRP